MQKIVEMAMTLTPLLILGCFGFFVLRGMA